MSDENLVCSACPAQFVVGYIEEYDGDDKCPDCGGKIMTKVQKFLSRARRRRGEEDLGGHC